MIKNFIQATCNLFGYFDSHIGDHFSQLIELAEQAHSYKERKQTDQFDHELEQLDELLDNKFFFTQEECNEIRGALADSLEQFYNKFIGAIVERYADPKFYKEIDDEIKVIAKKLQEEPLNFKADGIERTLQAGFMFNLHISRDEEDYADAWGQEMEDYFQLHNEDDKASSDKDCVGRFAEMDQVLFKKFSEEPDTPIYVLRLVYNFPYKSQES